MLHANHLLAQSDGSPGNRIDEQALEALSGLFSRMDILNHPAELMDNLANIPMVLAAVLLVVGLMCVLNGYIWHKWIVIILAFMAGIILGNLLSEQLGHSSVIAFSIGTLCAIIATPMLRITVALFGGLTGAFIGANVWTAVNAAQPETHWAGAAMGFIVLAMASFLLFKLVIIMFTAIGGASMVVLGAITLLLQVDNWEPVVRENILANDRLVPILVAVAAVGGFVLQQSRAHASAGAAKEKPAG